MNIVLEIPDTWKPLLGFETGDAAKRARQMLVIESYREGRLSRGQVAEMLDLDFHETEALLKSSQAEQQPTWDELEHSSQALRSLLES